MFYEREEGSFCRPRFLRPWCQIWDFDSQGLANVAWSFAVLGFKCLEPRRWLLRGGGSMIPMIPKHIVIAGFQNIFQHLWAMKLCPTLWRKVCLKFKVSLCPHQSEESPVVQRPKVVRCHPGCSQSEDRSRRLWSTGAGRAGGLGLD